MTNREIDGKSFPRDDSDRVMRRLAMAAWKASGFPSVVTVHLYSIRLAALGVEGGE